MRAVAVLALALAAPAGADTLVDHVDGITIDAQGRPDRFTGMVITSDGKVSRLLRRGDKRPERPDYLFDAKGAVLMPGLVDSHAHVMALGLSTLMLDLGGTASRGEALARLAAWASAHPDRPWIMGVGWDFERWGLPDLTGAEAAVAGRPVLLTSGNGESGWANGAALSAAGVAPAAGTGGLLRDGPLAALRKAAPQPRPEDRDAALAAAQRILLERGVTTVADMGTTIEDWQAYRRAGDLGSLRMRIIGYAAGIDAMVLIAGPGPSPWLYQDRLRLNGVLLPFDGPVESRGAWLKTPYADDARASGKPRTSETQLRNTMSRAAMDGFQVAVEARGDRAVGTVLDALGELRETYKGDRRWRIEGASLIDTADAGRLSGVTLSMQPGELDNAELLAARLGPARLAETQAWGTAVAVGAALAFGSGTPARTPDPFGQMATAISRQNALGQSAGAWQSAERLTREAALAALTSGGAKAAMAEGRFGSLAPGERADFVLLDADPLLATPQELRALRVRQVWVGGEKVFEQR